MDYFTCPNCGEEVPMKAKACPHCGSDKETGWSDQTYMDGVDIYDEEDYAETIRKEFGIQTKKMDVKKLVLAIIAGVVVLAFILTYIF
jgi:uncharacterized membrane protein YvbJ